MPKGNGYYYVLAAQGLINNETIYYMGPNHDRTSLATFHRPYAKKYERLSEAINRLMLWKSELDLKDGISHGWPFDPKRRYQVWTDHLVMELRDDTIEELIMRQVVYVKAAYEAGRIFDRQLHNRQGNQVRVIVDDTGVITTDNKVVPNTQALTDLLTA